eukprot:15467110-Alexandrium_andersonii.AAC.1
MDVRMRHDALAGIGCVCRRPGCNGEAPDAPDCVRGKPSVVKRSMVPPPAVQLLNDATPKPESQPGPMLVDQAAQEGQASERLKEIA